MKILVVEDNAGAIRKLLNQVLVERGYQNNELTVTTQLKMADILIEFVDFDIVFLDYVLPDGSSADYLEEWKKRGKLKDAQVVAISSNDECNQKLLDCGAQTAISKVNNFEKYVGEAIEKAINKRN